MTRGAYYISTQAGQEQCRAVFLVLTPIASIASAPISKEGIIPRLRQGKCTVHLVVSADAIRPRPKIALADRITTRSAPIKHSSAGCPRNSSRRKVHVARHANIIHHRENTH